MVHFRIKSVAEVVAERRNVVQEKYTGRGASSRRFVQKIGEMTFFCGRCYTGGKDGVRTYGTTRAEVDWMDAWQEDGVEE